MTIFVLIRLRNDTIPHGLTRIYNGSDNTAWSIVVVSCTVGHTNARYSYSIHIKSGIPLNSFIFLFFFFVYSTKIWLLKLFIARGRSLLHTYRRLVFRFCGFLSKPPIRAAIKLLKAHRPV